MSLPNIPASRLQRIVADTEFDKDFESFDALCLAVASTTWAKSFSLTAAIVAELIVKHQTITKVDKPAAVAPVTQAEPEVKTAVAPVTQAEPEIKTYDEAGNGRKQCPACSKYLGNRSKKCACGHVFDGTTAASKPEEIKTYDEAGKGRKQCPVCSKYLGNRAMKCACGHTFEVAATVGTPTVEAEPEARTTSVDPRRFGARYVVHAPSGSPPHKLESFGEEAVQDWAERCRQTYAEGGGWLSVNALKYFVRYLDLAQPDHNEVMRHLSKLDRRIEFEEETPV